MYSPAAWASALDDTIDVRVTVGPKGWVHGVEILKARHREFHEPTRAALMHWFFHPATGPGGKVPSTVDLRIGFSVERAQEGRPAQELE
jgi:outer membrane biosynthesis protein TonB